MSRTQFRLWILPVCLLWAVFISNPNQAHCKSGNALITVASTDTSHSDADTVFLRASKRNATVVVERKRGIGSARIRIMRSWNDRINLDFRGFAMLEKFSVRKGRRCIEGSLGFPATSIGNWVKESCDCARSKAGPDILNMRVKGTSIVFEIPAELARSNQSETLCIDWIDAYRN